MSEITPIQVVFQRVALTLFGSYLIIFPGATIVVALKRVPAWGIWVGAALLLIQGATVICWLIGEYKLRGALTVLVTLLFAWGIEYIGETTGIPFGRYTYTELLQPQLFGVVPLPII